MDPIDRVRYHAGFGPQLNSTVPSLSDLLWQGGSIQASFDDLFESLEALNMQANGPVPSSTNVKQSHFPRELVYGVSEICRMLREALSKCEDSNLRQELITASLKLDIAWSAILAGDIDNLGIHVSEETEAAE